MKSIYDWILMLSWLSTLVFYDEAGFNKFFLAISIIISILWITMHRKKRRIKAMPSDDWITISTADENLKVKKVTDFDLCYLLIGNKKYLVENDEAKK